MTKTELEDSILGHAHDFYCLVGPNTSGKTYFITSLFDKTDRALFFRENGEVASSDIRKNVSIQGNKYIYEEDRERGSSRKIGEISEDINKSSLQIIEDVKKMKEDIDLSHLSLGTRKLTNILDSFLKYNLNNIEYILMDEPENSLDDRNIKVISKIIQTLLKNGKKIVMVTHSPRLLEIMKVDVDNIFVFFRPSTNEVRNISFSDIESTFDSVGEKLNQLCKDHQESITEVEKYRFLPNTVLRHCYLKSLVHSYEFYKVLFYSEIYIVEGLTEFYLLKEIQENLPISNNYYVADGKYRIPFLLEMFSSICENVHCFFDTDLEKNTNSFSASLTAFINEKYCERIKLYNVTGDVESFLGIDPKGLVGTISSKTGEVSGRFKDQFIKEYKHFVCYYHVINNKSAKEKVIQLFRNSQPYSKYNNYE